MWYHLFAGEYELNGFLASEFEIVFSPISLVEGCYHINK